MYNFIYTFIILFRLFELKKNIFFCFYKSNNNKFTFQKIIFSNFKTSITTPENNIFSHA